MRRGALSGTQAFRSVAALIFALSLAGCAVGPDYSPNAAPVPTQYKELKGWKAATPRDGADRGDWWRFYRDPKLAVLLKQVEISNQTVAAAAASYEQARALVRQAQAALFPMATANYSATHTHTGANAGGFGGAGGGGNVTIFTPQLASTWDLDVWGKVRRQIESNTSAAQASAADLDNAKLSAQARLPRLFQSPRRQLAARSPRAHGQEDKETLRITQDKFNAGFCPSPGGSNCVSEAELRSAQALVFNAESQAINVGVQRAQFEHAIAMLIGRPPAELTIATYLLGGNVPKIPVAVPSTLLERRPDIAAAERTMQEQNALIGVAVAAYYPDIILSGMLQWVGTTPFPFNAANAVWSLGAAGTETLFDGWSARGAGRCRARALLAERRQLPADRAHRFPASGRSARRHPNSQAAARQAAGCGQGAARGGARIYEPISGWHDRFHHRGDGAIDAADPMRKPN